MVFSSYAKSAALLLVNPRCAGARADGADLFPAVGRGAGGGDLVRAVDARRVVSVRRARGPA